ncbi:MAG: aminopeptidase [Spirochaetes bacterium]|nr:aminopeptidase [Spirochaetota bacterium]
MHIDQRLKDLSVTLIDYSVSLKRGETLYLDLIGSDGIALAREIVRAVTERGAIPYWNFFDDNLSAAFFAAADETQHRAFAEFHKKNMAACDAYIGIRSSANPFDASSVPASGQKLKRKYFWTEVHEHTRLKKKWCVLRYPNNAMAVMSKKSTEAFEDFYFRVCNIDYARFSKAMDPLQSLMARTDRVQITGPGTDISFSIKGLPPIKCDGKYNIPDGEVFTAPVRESVNGIIQYNTPTVYDGHSFANMRFEVKDGRIVDYKAEGDRAALDAIFSTDDGARFFGEFSLGLHPHVDTPMCDALFDEKIYGSLHFTPGNAYDDCNNGNKSAIHWDLVLVQTPAYGGGEIRFDGTLIRKDGEFVLEELMPLSRGALTASR